MDLNFFWFGVFFTLACFGCWASIISLVFLNFLFYLTFNYEKRCPKNDFTVCIVGAGISGIGMGLKLSKLGIKYEIHDKNPDLGGTWFSTGYPGCGCDIPPHLYSYSFEPYPFWRRKFAIRDDLAKYLRRVAQKHEISINFNSNVISAEWNMVDKNYTVTFENGCTKTFNAIISACGILRDPYIPNILGAESFHGQIIHSSQLDEKHQNSELKGQKVAVIGTGASAVQIVPSIARKVDQLYVFQRSPAWCVPRYDREVPNIVKTAFNYIPGVLYSYRLLLFWVHEGFYFTLFRENSLFRRPLRWLIRLHIRRTVKDPALVIKLTPDPQLYPGHKRITPSDHYLQAFNRGNVHLVTSPITGFTKNRIRTLDGRETKIDTVIYATGYSASNTLNAFDVRNGEQTLSETWNGTPKAYLGITVAHFPNFFMLLGPNSFLGHNSATWMVECQIGYICDILRQMTAGQIPAVQVSTQRFQKYQDFLQKYMKNKVFKGESGQTSWYHDENGVNFTLWPSNLVHYWWKTRKANLEDYQILRQPTITVSGTGTNLA